MVGVTAPFAVHGAMIGGFVDVCTWVAEVDGRGEPSVALEGSAWVVICWMFEAGITCS